MLFFLPQIIRINLIILLIFVTMASIDCRAGGHGRGGRVRISKLIKNKFRSDIIHRQSSILRKPTNRILVSGGGGGGGVALVAGILALRSFVSNNNKELIQSRRLLTNGTGNFCVNRENYSNFIFNEFRCPLSPIFTTNYRYCCGSYHQQYCCSFWESSARTISVIIGIIFACSLFVIFLICFIVYYRRYLKRKESPRVRSYIRYKRPNQYGNNPNRPTIG